MSESATQDASVYNNQSPGALNSDSDTQVSNIVVQSDGPDPNLLPFPIVGIGGSAGGVEAYIELFQNLPADTGMAFVVVPHLAPDQKSHLVEILAARSRIPVMQIEARMQPAPNRVYVLPPNTMLTIHDGVLELAPRPEQRPSMVIDEFFRSLAADQKNRVIGVVLSGMDSDGALGLKTIKGEGGIAIVQAPESAKYPSMPRSSIGADHVDLVLAPADIASELARIGAQFSYPDLLSLEAGQAPEGQEQQFTHIYNMLTSVCGIDFRGYKPATLQRRIGRRMLLKHFESVAEYLRYLQVHPEELQALHEDVLVGVTRFFRDPEVFGLLKSDILPRILENRSPAQQVRIWVAGCSTGEEVYSIAISLLEHLSSEPVEPPIQIFGTDASDDSIQSARAGVFPESITADVSSERLRRFFTKTDKGYQVAKRVRDLCIFARQNLCNDPPFGHLDLISCRNVLIYLGPELQKRIIPSFHYALRPGGFLLLGTSETIHSHTDLFSLVDRKHKFYTKLPTPTPLNPDIQRTFASRLPGDMGQRQLHQETWSDVDLQRAADRIVLARYGPPGVIVNENLEILQSRGHTAPFLEMAQGASSLHLLRMLKESIASEAHDAIRRAVDQNIAVHVDNLVLRDGDHFENASLEVLPIQTNGSRQRCFLVLFPRETAPVELGPPGARTQVTQSTSERDLFLLKLITISAPLSSICNP